MQQSVIEAHRHNARQVALASLLVGPDVVAEKSSSAPLGWSFNTSPALRRRFRGILRAIVSLTSPDFHPPAVVTRPLHRIVAGAIHLQSLPLLRVVFASLKHSAAKASAHTHPKL